MPLNELHIDGDIGPTGTQRAFIVGYLGSTGATALTEAVGPYIANKQDDKADTAELDAKDQKGNLVGRQMRNKEATGSMEVQVRSKPLFKRGDLFVLEDAPTVIYAVKSISRSRAIEAVTTQSVEFYERIGTEALTLPTLPTP